MSAMSPTSPPRSPEALLAARDPEQREVAEALRGPVRVLAGAGTGKTRAITHRIAYGVACGIYQPRQVLAVTFTTRAAGELRTRLRALGAEGVQARTFHSAALRQARYFWPKAYGGELRGGRDPPARAAPRGALPAPRRRRPRTPARAVGGGGRAARAFPPRSTAAGALLRPKGVGRRAPAAPGEQARARGAPRPPQP